MHQRGFLFWAKFASIASVIPVFIWADSSGPIPHAVGAPPNNQTCNQIGCHTGTAVNGGGGQVAITFADGDTYTPGTRKRVTVRITDTAGRLYGFQASVRLAGDRTKQAGSLATVDANTFVQCEDGRIRPSAGCSASAPVEFIQHGTNPTSNTSGVFNFDWTPPSSAVGDVVVYVAGNAGNGNGQNTGDHIYTANATLRAASSGGGGGPLPSISDGGVADAFNFRAGTASNTWTAIFGSNLTTETKTWDGDPAFSEGRLPTSLSGVSVTVNGRAAPVYFISPTQINILSPTDDATGNVQVVVKNANGESTPLTVSRAAALPAFYAPFSQSGRLFATAVATSGTLLGKTGVDPRVTRGVRPGETILLYATGMGVTNPTRPAEQLVTSPAPLVTQPVIRFGNQTANLQFGGLVASGLYQFNVVVPDVSDGDVQLTAEIGATRSADNVYITVQR